MMSQEEEVATVTTERMSNMQNSVTIHYHYLLHAKYDASIVLGRIVGAVPQDILCSFSGDPSPVSLPQRIPPSHPTSAEWQHVPLPPLNSVTLKTSHQALLSQSSSMSWGDGMYPIQWSAPGPIQAEPNKLSQVTAVREEIKGGR
jgi:hypothetical protein